MFRTILAIAAAGCVTSMTVDAAERGDSRGTTPKHSGTTHRPSTIESRVSKASSNRNTRLSKARRQRSSSDNTRRRRDRQPTASNRDATRTVNDGIQPDANVQVELPRRENENATDNEAKDADKSSILFGGETDNDGPDRP